MPRTNVRPGDVTGMEKARLAKENAEAVALRSKELTLMNAEQADIDAEPIDLTQGPNARPVVEIEVTDVVDVTPANKNLRVNTDLEEVTIGAGNHYNFLEGRNYIVPAHVYNHLEEKGYVWH
jgi:hypothetical protein